MTKLDLKLYDNNVWGEIVLNRNFLHRDMIFDHNPDICCFQEFADASIRYGDTGLDKIIAERYAEVPTKTGDTNRTPIFYLKDKFNVVESGECIFPGFNMFESKKLTWAVFEEKTTGIMFGMLSTHFWNMRRGEIDNQQRIENAKILLSHVKSINLKYDIPVFVAGDLNSGINAQTEESTWLYMKEHMIDTRDVAKITTDAMTCHLYPKMTDVGTYEASTDKCDFTLDYIFLNDMKNVEIHSFELDETERAYIASDHCPIILKATISK